MIAALVSVFGVGANCGPSGPPHALFLDTPTSGTFTNDATVLVTGHTNRPIPTILVNGVSTPLVNNEFSTTVSLDANLVFNRITVEGVFPSGKVLRETAVLIVGDGVNSGFVTDGATSPEGLGLRIGNTGLDQISPVVESLSGDSLDISDLITDQNPIASGSFSGISYTANVVEVGFGGFGLGTSAAAGGIDATITIDDFFLEVDLDLGFLGSCTLEVETASAEIAGSYDMAPMASDPSLVDVNLVSAVGVTLGGFNSQFVGGVCNDPLIGDIIGLIMGEGEIQQLMQDGFEDNLADPDGPGPLDSPLAGAIETALAGISIAGPVGDALGGVVDAPISDVAEDANGLTIIADAAITSASPAPGAPDLPASYSVAETFPTFGATTPVGGLPYGMAFAISNSAMNQLIKTQIEGGLLQSELTEFLGLPLTAEGLGLFIPEFLQFGTRPLVIAISPKTAPVFTGAAGPQGEFAEMKIAALQVEISLSDTDQLLLAMEVDMDAGLDLAFTPAGLEFSLATPGAGGAIAITITENPLGSNEASLLTVFSQLFPLFAPELENAIEAFPVPSLLGLDLSPVELARMPGGYIGLFADLVQIPTTTLENVVFSDLSSGAFQEQGGCWLREWRHRLSGVAFGPAISANMRGMLGADAGCTTNDANSVATAAYSIEFDVVAVAGEQWTLDIDHSILGALDRISDGYNDGIGFQDGGGFAEFQTPITASYSVDGGSATAFDFTPSVTSITDGIGGGSNNQDVEFSGANGVTLQGTTNASIRLDFSFAMRTFSNSNTAFPTANGDEMAIRLGKNDTIDNNFTAGSYPGMGGRNIADDGHVVGVALTVAPTP